MTYVTKTTVRQIRFYRDYCKMTYASIGEKLKLKTPHVAYHYRQSLKTQERERKVELKLSLILAMLQDGNTISSIADTLQLSRQAIYNILEKNGIDRKELKRGIKND